jgi:surfactin synthase thioesterase subunit
VAANPRTAALWLPRLRADLTIHDTYVHRHTRRLTCPLTILLGSTDVLTTTETAAPWQQLTTGPSARRTVPGDHFFPLTHPAKTLQAVCPNGDAFT